MTISLSARRLWKLADSAMPAKGSSARAAKLRMPFCQSCYYIDVRGLKKKGGSTPRRRTWYLARSPQALKARQATGEASTEPLTLTFCASLAARTGHVYNSLERVAKGVLYCLIVGQHARLAGRMIYRTDLADLPKPQHRRDIGSRVANLHMTMHASIASG